MKTHFRGPVADTKDSDVVLKRIIRISHDNRNPKVVEIEATVKDPVEVTVKLVTTTAFNAGTTNPVTVGTQGSPAGLVNSNGAVGVSPVGTLVLTQRTKIVAAYQPTGTNPTAGNAYIIVQF